MFFSTENLFGSLASHPPQNQQSISFSSLPFHTSPPIPKSLSTIHLLPPSPQHFNLLNPFLNAISLARSKSNLFKTSQRYDFYANKSQKIKQIDIIKNIENLKWECKKSDIDLKYQQRIREKSKQIGKKNQRKQQTSMKQFHKNLKIKKQNLQKSYFYQINNQTSLLSKTLHNSVFTLEKEKIIVEKTIFKEEMEKYDIVMNEKIMSREVELKNRKHELKESLKELKNVKKVNQVDQRKAIGNLKRQLIEERGRVGNGVIQELRNHKQRASLLKVAKK